MNSILTIENTSRNEKFAEEYMDICMDYEHHFLTDDEFDAKLSELNEKYGKQPYC